MDFSYLAADLDISSNVRDSLRHINKLSDLETIAETLTSHFVNDEHLLAPRLLMKARLFSTPSKIEDYIESLSHRLSKKCIDFMRKYANEINAFYQEVHDPCYKYVKDYIAASKWVKSNLLDAGFGKNVLECPEFQAIRVSVQFYHQYTHSNTLEKFIRKAKEIFYQYITHASPTLFNAGTVYPQLASCFQVHLSDDTTSLMQRGVADVAEISKNNGGVGVGANNIRHSNISFSGKSKGAIPFIRIYDKTFGCVDQGGKRNGAGTIFLRDWHIDVREFISCLPADANPSSAIRNIQGCIWVSDLLFERYRQNGEWTFFCPHQCPLLENAYNDEFEKNYVYYENLIQEREQEYSQLEQELTLLEENILSYPDQFEEIVKKISMQKQKIAQFEKSKLMFYKRIPARDFVHEICQIQIRDGPYIMNGDAINRKSQVDNIGPVNCSNLCTEIVQHSSDTEIPTCNLGAMNLPKYVKGQVPNYLEDNVENMQNDLKHAFDFETFSYTIRSLTENINQMIDENYYPLDRLDEKTQKMSGPISDTNRRNRPIGIGVSGLYNAETRMGFGFDSSLGFQFNKTVFACMYYNALVESLRLAVRDGAYSSFRTGKCRIYNSRTKSFQEYEGSPLSNGFFQFDLWNAEYHYLRDKGRLQEYETYDDGDTDELYNLENIQPLSPEVWGQSSLTISEGNITFTVYPRWDSLRYFIQKFGVRNSLLIAPMPTASTANIVSAVEAFEAPTGLIYAKRIKDVNDIYAVPEFLVEAKKMGIFDVNLYQFISSSQGSIQDLDLFLRKFYPEKEFDWPRIKRLQSIFKTAYEISQRDTARQCQQRGIYVDQSQSYNVFIPAPSVDILTAFHLFTNSLALKTNIYYLRQLPPVPPFPISFKPEIVIFAKELLDKRRHYHSEIEEKEEEKEQFCTRGSECISCSV